MRLRLGRREEVEGVVTVHLEERGFHLIGAAVVELERRRRACQRLWLLALTILGRAPRSVVAQR